MHDFEVRPARPEDREAVLAFCQQTWEWGDYLEYVWDEWLNNSQGKLFVATKDGQPVAVANMRMLNKTEAWFEGMRVDPAFRQHGIASALFDAQLVEAKHRGATTVRLITESTNTTAIRLLERSFMNRIGAYTIYRAVAATIPTKKSYALETPVLATSADLYDIIDYLNTSNIFPAIGGLYYQGFTAYTITKDLVLEKITAQQLYILRRWDRLDGLVIAEPRAGHQGKHLFVGYIDGTTESISMIAYALRHFLHDLDLESIIAHVPDLMMVRDAFVGAEYEWDGRIFYTYERILV
ncbi:MAG TPA: GNAT family N-acetyltransferase [Ktedonobacteraceae bacterium]|nr:GNAT family N-acetyltransferase [Ktedonobacteraceae bacterium]